MEPVTARLKNSSTLANLKESPSPHAVDQIEDGVHLVVQYR